MTDTAAAVVDTEAVETKLASARTRLILDKPFLGALVLRLPMRAASDDWCPTTATDARTFYYNPSYIDALSLDETQFMLAHEALHCALSHFARRQHRIKHRWDLACDYAINPLLIDDGLRPPPNALPNPPEGPEPGTHSSPLMRSQAGRIAAGCAPAPSGSESSCSSKHPNSPVDRERGP